MKPEIIILQPLRVLFVSKTGNYTHSIEQAWKALGSFVDKHNLVNTEAKAIGIPYHAPGEVPEDQMRYDACLTFEGNIVPEGEVGIQTIEGGRYAVFVDRGKIDSIYDVIFKQWLPESKETLRNAPMFEMYTITRDENGDEKPETAIFIPIN